MAPAACAAARRPRWQTKAATSRTSRAAVAAWRRAGRRKVLIRGRASAKITGGLLPRQRTVVVHRHTTGRPGRREGVSCFAHNPTGTNVERNFRERQRGPLADASGWYAILTAVGRGARPGR